MIPHVAAGIAGLLLSLAFPPWGMNLLAWVALVPLLWAVHHETSPRRCAVFGAVFGLVFFAMDVRWVTETLTLHGHFSPVPAALVFLLMVAFLSLYPAGCACILAWFRNKGFSISVLAPFVWTSMEYARSTVCTGFPWDLLGYSQAGSLSIIQVADITGVYGISFMVMLVNGCAWELTQRTTSPAPMRRRLIVSTVCLLAAFLIYGQVRQHQFSHGDSPERPFTVGVLQGNIPQGLKWERAMREHTFLTYEALGRQAVQEGAALLVWPETSAPVMYGGADLDWQIPGLISKNLNVPMVVGAPSEKKVGTSVHYYNSAFLLDGTSIRSRFDKIHLVPFGEYMPLSWILPLGPGIAAREADYSPGHLMTVMSLPHGPRFSVLICYEAIFPELARLAVRRGAEMLLNITNDGWFGESAAPYQHLAMAGMRSIENRVWVIRAANTGVSAAFDPTGRMIKQIPLEKQGVFTVNIFAHRKAQTLYSRFGDVFAWGCIGMCVVLGLRTWRKPVSRGRG